LILIAEIFSNLSMKSILKYIIKNGLKDKLYLGLFIAIFIAFGVSIFLGSTMLVEQNQSSLVFVLATVRTILSFGIILFVCINITRSFENKEIEFILSKSISRENFILGYLFGFFISALLILLPFSLLTCLIFKVNYIGMLTWFATTTIEILIVISFALLCSLMLKNSFSAIFSAIGFYILSRLMGMFVMAINFGDPVNVDSTRDSLGFGLKILSVIFPRLDLYSQSSWAVYGLGDNSFLQIIFIQSIIYLPLMIFMAFHDFKKKQF